ncbi:MAG: response regulator transcription factor [Spirochaetales bacterium]|nr:response regulator transcription factor [Spirochaetales bacterium]
MSSPGLQKILLVEDEESLAIGLTYNLEEEGYRVVRAEDGVKACESFQKEQFDLIILDIMLPHMDGFEVAEKIREISPRVPILMLTARTQIDDKIKGLRTGVDDYLTKPFHITELLLRIKGMLKRSDWYKPIDDSKGTYRFGSRTFNFSTLTCTVDNLTKPITPLEARLLQYFFSNPGRIISRGELLTKVWETTSDIQTRTIDIFISRLRKYLEKDPSNPVFLKNIRGAGYLFDPGRESIRESHPTQS